jgi:hypothetical protein
MPDKILTCKNCQNPFVYSEYEQTLKDREFKVSSSKFMDNIYNQELPKFCPICAAIKASESKHPPKPKK